MDSNLEELKTQVASLSARVAMAEAQIAEMDDDMPEMSDVVIGDDSEATPAEYTSFFKVWAERGGSSVRIGVKDGSTTSTLPNDYCGEVRVNTAELYVPEYDEVFTEADTNYAAYLLCWVDELLGAGAEVVITNTLDLKPSAPSRADPAPANIVTHGFLYLGRVAVDAEFNPTPHQDYLQGGTAQIVLLGPCGGDVALYLQQGGT